MPVIALASQKGGVGKTTVALNLSLSLAARGWRTLLIDADPQGSIGLSLQGSTRTRAGLLECLRDKRPLHESILATRVPNLTILPVGQVGEIRPDDWTSIFEERASLARLLQQAESQNDAVVVDTASGMYGPTLEVLRRCRYVLAPLQAEPLALRTTAQVLGAIGHLKSDGAATELVGFVVTMLNAHQAVPLAVAEEAWGRLPQHLVFDAILPRDPVFLDASAKGVPLGLLSKRRPALAAAFDQIAAELERRIGLKKEEADDEPLSLVD
jgi:chromosome partitioning protein